MDKKMTTLAQLQKRGDLVLLTDFQDVDNLRREYEGYDSFLVKSENGEYIEIWGYVGAMPYLSKLVSKLK